jgi:hypothetical protein
MKTKVLTVSAWIATATSFFFLGWVYKDSFSEQPENYEERSKPLKEPLEKTLTNNFQMHTFGLGREIHWQLRDIDGKAIFTAVANKDGKTIDGLIVYDTSHNTTFYAKHDKNGRVREIFVRANGRAMHHWGFYDDGKMEFVSKFIFPSDPGYTGGSYKEVRQYYDRQGVATEVKTINCVTTGQMVTKRVYNPQKSENIGDEKEIQ